MHADLALFVLLTGALPAAAQDAGTDGELEPLEEAEEIVVTGTRTPRRLGEAPVAVEVIDRDDIDASGAEDVADVLEQHPGVVVDRGLFGAAVRLQGLNPEHTLVLIDGQRVVGRKDGTFDLSRIPVDTIERIEIVKGAASALYGSDAMGGVVNIITRRGARPFEASVHGRGGTLSTVDTRVGVGASSESSSVRIDAGWHSNRAWDLDPELPGTTGSGVGQLDLALAVDTRPHDDLTLRLAASYAVQDVRGIDPGPANALLDRRNVIEDALVRASADWLFDEVSRWSTTAAVSLFRDQFVHDQRNAGELDRYEETQEMLTQLSSQVDRVMGPHLLSIGVEGFLSNIESPRLDAGRGSRQRGGVYVQDEIRLLRAPRLTGVPGIRADGDSWFGGTVAPRLGVRFDPVSSLTLRASAGSGWRAPSFRELLLSFSNPGVGYTVVGNPDLVPERSLGATAGIEWVPVRAFSLSVSGWFDRLRDLIQLASLGDGPTTQFGYVNIAEARSRGLEAAVAAEVAQWLDVGLSGTLTDAIDLSTGNPLEGRALLQGTGSIRAEVPVRLGPAISARAAVFGPRPFYQDLGNVPVGFGGNTDGIRVDAPPYALIDAKISQPLRRHDEVVLFVGVDNLLDAGDPNTLPAPPRLVYGGLDVRMARPARTRSVNLEEAP